MARPDFIREQLSVTQALVKFIQDHQGGVGENLDACLTALEKKDIDSAVRHAQMVKPHGMGGVTDWSPPVIHPNETRGYNAIVLSSLVNHWCYMMSLSFDDRDQVQRAYRWAISKRG